MRWFPTAFILSTNLSTETFQRPLKGEIILLHYASASSNVLTLPSLGFALFKTLWFLFVATILQHFLPFFDRCLYKMLPIGVRTWVFASTRIRRLFLLASMRLRWYRSLSKVEEIPDVIYSTSHVLPVLRRPNNAVRLPLVLSVFTCLRSAARRRLRYYRYLPFIQNDVYFQVSA